MKKRMLFLLVLFIYACGDSTTTNTDASKTPKPKSMIADEVPNDGKGIGETKSVSLNTPLNASMVANGKAIYELKCAACHRLGEKRVVGPGWKGLTEKRKPEWIMNMITNVDVMLEKDPVAQELLKQCLTRMPNQNLTVQDSRDILEFMYANDGQEVAQK